MHGGGDREASEAVNSIGCRSPRRRRCSLSSAAGCSKLGLQIRLKFRLGETRRGERDEEADLASTRLSRAKAEGGEATADLHRSAAAWQASTGMAYSKVKTSDGSPESSRPKLAKPSGKR